jgi:hypothetical protein
MKPEVTVLVVDDHPLLRHGLREVIGSNSRFKIIGEASDGEEALRSGFAKWSGFLVRAGGGFFRGATVLRFDRPGFLSKVKLRRQAHWECACWRPGVARHLGMGCWFVRADFRAAANR